MWILINKNGVWMMEGEKATELVRKLPDTTQLIGDNLAGYNVIVNFDAPNPELFSSSGKVIKKRTSKCDQLVTKWEGYHKALPNGSCAAYPDPGPTGKPVTIGFGTTRYNVVNGRFGRTLVKMGDVITRSEAEMELAYELNDCETSLANMLGDTLVTQSMFDALVSFAYNMGIAGASQQINRVIQGKYEECAKSFDLYVKAGGKVLQGLVNRRNDEEAMFRSEPFPVKGAPTPVYGKVARLEKSALDVMHDGNWEGLVALSLVIGDEQFDVASGARGVQNFRKPTDPKSVPGNLEPLPQGTYEIGQIDWANGTDNYNATHGPGLGPVWVSLKAMFPDDRSAFGFHLDANMGTSPGSAGCVVVRDFEELKRLVAALRKWEPKTLEVSWGLR